MATYIADKSQKVLHRVDRLVDGCHFDEISEGSKEVVFTDYAAGEYLEKEKYTACSHCLAESPIPEMEPSSAH